MPEWLFGAYDRAQPRLEAEETLLTIRTMLGGTGHMKEEDFNQFQNQLMRIINGGREHRAVGRPSSPEEMRMFVRQLGLGGFKVEIEE